MCNATNGLRRLIHGSSLAELAGHAPLISQEKIATQSALVCVLAILVLEILGPISQLRKLGLMATGFGIKVGLHLLPFLLIGGENRYSLVLNVDGYQGLLWVALYQSNRLVPCLTDVFCSVTVFTADNLGAGVSFSDYAEYLHGYPFCSSAARALSSMASAIRLAARSRCSAEPYLAQRRQPPDMYGSTQVQAWLHGPMTKHGHPSSCSLAVLLGE